MALVNNQAALNTVYNYFLTAYAPTTNNTTKYDTHKKSELKSVYNSIVKQSKDSPSYIIDTSNEVRSFAIGMKEGARQFGSSISSLSVENSGDVLGRKVASTTNDALVSARFIGEPEDALGDVAFDIQVDKLASPQRNTGVYLESDALVQLPADAYSFDIGINDTDYEFQFNVSDSDTNRSLQDKLVSLINRSNIGITASVDEDENGNTALVLESVATGVSEDKEQIFNVSDDATSKTAGAVDYLGIADISQNASNAQFTLNGTQRTAFANAFTVDKKFEINLKDITQGESVTIGLKADIESMTDNINQLTQSYNTFIDKAKAYSGTNVKTDTLLADLKRTTNAYRDSLGKMGISFNDEGIIETDEEKLKDALRSSDSEDNLKTIKNFTNSLLRKSGQISLNPMNYVQKTVVAYKNPGKTYPNPYITSVYSGMMFNSYC